MARTILLKVHEIGRRYEEGRVKAGSTIYPGMLIDYHTDGTLKPHAGDGLSGNLMIAIEDGMRGITLGSILGNTVNDPYPAGDLVRFVTLAPGERANMILKDGQTTTIGGTLTSNGDGKLRVGISGTDALLVTALEIVVASGADAFVQVEAGPRART